MQRRHVIAAPLLGALPAWAHHGWSSFDQARPLYLEGRVAQVAWRNPHVELKLDLPADGLKLPPDLATRSLPAQTAPVDGAALLKAAQLPTRRDIDRPLVVGSLVFGVGWGLAGFCPGPAVVALGAGHWQALVFVLAMLAGMAVYDLSPSSGPGTRSAAHPSQP